MTQACGVLGKITTETDGLSIWKNEISIYLEGRELYSRGLQLRGQRPVPVRGPLGTEPHSSR